MYHRYYRITAFELQSALTAGRWDLVIKLYISPWYRGTFIP